MTRGLLASGVAVGLLAATVAADNEDDGPVPLAAADAALIGVSAALFLALSVVSGCVLWPLHSARSEAPGSGKEESTGGNATRGGSNATTQGESVNSGRNTPLASSSAASSALGSPLEAAGGADDGAGVSIGVEMRARLFRTMFLATTLRACSLVTELAVVSSVVQLPPTAQVRRLLAAFLWLPSMLFVTLYGVVLLFWIQLCYACGGTASPWPRRIFFALNVLLYIGFALLILLATSSSQIWQWCDLAQSVFYVGGLLGIAHYGMQLVRFFRLQSNDDDFLGPYPSSSTGGRGWVVTRRQIALRRITAVCILLCLLFTIKAVYLVVLGTGYLRSKQAQYRTPVGISHVASEFAVHFLTEFIPCALLLLFMRRSRNGVKSDPQATRSEATLSRSSIGSRSRENPEYLPMNPSRINSTSGSTRGFNMYGSNLGMGPRSNNEESMAMLNSHPLQQTNRPAYGSVGTSGRMQDTGVRNEGYTSYNVNDTSRQSKMNGSTTARRELTNEYRRRPGQ